MVAYDVGKQLFGGGFPGKTGTKPVNDIGAGRQLLNAQRSQDIRDGFLPCS
jgi:hypothetical protein